MPILLQGKTALDMSGDEEVIEYLREHMSAQQVLRQNHGHSPDLAALTDSAKVCPTTLQ